MRSTAATLSAAFPSSSVRVRLQVLETPGHTAESISILVYDLEHDSIRPYAVLTGDTLFVGDVGRPDLRST
jgi:glyoxylase-like metal-dependent hydrolase (beta-lactamase superfamily II)